MIDLLIVDDEVLNLRIIEESLEDQGFVLTKAESGIEALEILRSSNKNFSAIILDRLMPEMDGIEVLRKIKTNSKYKDIPVILQTALGSNEDILDGLEAGAYYYLTKPYSKKVLVSIVNHAVDNYFQYKKAKEDLCKSSHLLHFMACGEFRLRDFDEMLEIAPVLSNFFPDPNRVLTGIIELISNSIEHGNLEVGFQTKVQWKDKGIYNAEIAKRFSEPRWKDRYVKIVVKKEDNRYIMEITDQGNGFDFSQFTNLRKATNHLFLSSGRGILMAMTLSFDEVIYEGKGNRVQAVVFSGHEKKKFT